MLRRVRVSASTSAVTNGNVGNLMSRYLVIQSRAHGYVSTGWRNQCRLRAVLVVLIALSKQVRQSTDSPRKTETALALRCPSLHPSHEIGFRLGTGVRRSG